MTLYLCAVCLQKVAEKERAVIGAVIHGTHEEGRNVAGEGKERTCKRLDE